MIFFKKLNQLTFSDQELYKYFFLTISIDFAFKETVLYNSYFEINFSVDYEICFMLIAKSMFLDN